MPLELLIMSLKSQGITLKLLFDFSKRTKSLYNLKNNLFIPYQFSSVHFSCSVMSNSLRPSLPVHQLPEFTQTHVHQVGDAIQPSHPLSSPSPPAPNPSQHQGLSQ